MTTPRVREARPDDLGVIADFTRSTFPWGDYVAEAFSEWLEAPDSRLLVAVDDRDRPVGLGRAVLLSPREAWLHAARIHPDHRRQGIGSILNDALCTWARDRGAVVARLLIEEWNEPAQRQVSSLGYRKVATWFSANLTLGGDLDPSTNGGRRVPGDERLGPGSRAEIDPAWIAWSSSEAAVAGRRLFPVGWYFRQMVYGDVEKAARSGSLWHSPSGWVIGAVDDGELFVSWLVTSDLDIERLVKAIVDRAERLDADSIRIMAPRIDWLEDALARTGWDIHPSSVWTVEL